VAADGGYDGTIFHRVIKYGMVQGGDPLTKDPAKARLYGTGGLGVLKGEMGAEPATRGAVAAVLQPNKPDTGGALGLHRFSFTQLAARVAASALAADGVSPGTTLGGEAVAAVLQPNKPDSGGAQFFVCVTDQPSLSGKYTVFGRVSEGMDVVQAISETPATPEGLTTERVEIVSVEIRDTPPPEPEPFSTETPEALAAYRAVLETAAGPITIEFMPGKAPEHVRAFLRLASAGILDGTSFHRVVKGFVIQTGFLSTRGPLTEKQQKLVRPLQPEFNDTKHTRGIVSMARGDDPASAPTSFFIVTGDASSLDGKYTVFGRVVDGMAAVDAIEQTPLQGEAPVSRIDLKQVRIVK
jgi:peptidyl-prolyl cis-trans isomerase B (cyclophilin B)